MKKFLLSLLLPLLVGMILCPITVYAGDINSAEQTILDAISETQVYDGAYYKVTDAYITKVKEYLSRDNINMTQKEADSYIVQFQANIASGISAGYMEKIGEVETANYPETEEEPDSTDSKDDTGKPIDNVENPAETGQGKIEDNTIGSTTDGEIEYTVLPVDAETMYAWDTDTLEVHTEAYKDSDTLGTLKKGDAVTVIGAATTGWAQIEYNGQTGYVSATYLRTQGYMDNADEEAQADLEIETEEEDELSERKQKDYSDAAPVAKKVNLGKIALAVAVVFCVAMGVIIFHNRSRMKNKMKNKPRKR